MTRPLVLEIAQEKAYNAFAFGSCEFTDKDELLESAKNRQKNASLKGASNGP